MRHTYIVTMRDGFESNSKVRVLKEFALRDRAEEYIIDKMRSMADYMSDFYLSVHEVWTNTKEQK